MMLMDLITLFIIECQITTPPSTRRCLCFLLSTGSTLIQLYLSFDSSFSAPKSVDHSFRPNTYDKSPTCYWRSWYCWRGRIAFKNPRNAATHGSAWKRKNDFVHVKCTVEGSIPSEGRSVEERTELIHHKIDLVMKGSQEADERWLDSKVRCSPGGGDYTIICCTKGSQFSQQSSTNSTNWSRQLQNDCDVTELKEKLRNAEEEIRHLRLEKVSVKKKLNATKMELDSLIRSYDELQAEYNESGFLQVWW